MSDRERYPSSWFEGWVIDGTDPAKPHDARKREVAEELLEAVEKGGYTAQTLQLLTQVWDHECLCLYSEHDTTSQDPINAALNTEWTSEALQRLLACRVRSISTPSHFERELQSRSVLSVLSLLRAQNVEAFRSGESVKLRQHFRNRYQDLEWSRIRPGPFTREKFRQFEAACLLCSGGEYVKVFKRAEPLFVTVLSKFAHFLFAAAPLAALAASGTGALAWQKILEDLDKAFQPLRLTPNKRYEALFNLQALTRLAVASQFVAKVITGCTTLDQTKIDCAFESLSRSLSVAKGLLRKILAELSRRPEFESNLSASFPHRDYFLAMLNRGPPDMDPYFYYYGLLDCAAQLGRIIPNSEIEQVFRTRMEQIILKSKDESFRWKAVEFLLADSSARIEQSVRIRGIFRSGPGLNSDIDTVLCVISDCFDEEDGYIIPQPSHSRSSSQTLAMTLNGSSQIELSIRDWSEEDFPPSAASIQAHQHAITLRRGGLFDRRQYLSVGLSLDSRFAFFRTENEIILVSLANRVAVQNLSRQDLGISSLKCAQAVLSRRFLAILAKETLYVRDVSLLQAVGPKTQNITLEQGWNADCLAIYDSGQRTWISIGGRSYVKGVMHSTVKICQVDTSSVMDWSLKLHASELISETLKSDFLKSLKFCPDGIRLTGLTNNNRILSWVLKDEAKMKQQPFKLSRKYFQETRAYGITSITPFYSQSHKPYVLSTTWPSSQRWCNDGEWSFISPLGDEPAKVPPKLIHDIHGLKDAGPILAGAVSPDGKIIALLEKTGTIYLFPLQSNRIGLRCVRKPIVLDQKLSFQDKIPSVSLGFHVQHPGQQLYLYAVDINGNVVEKELGPVDNASPNGVTTAT